MHSPFLFSLHVRAGRPESGNKPLLRQMEVELPDSGPDNSAKALPPKSRGFCGAPKWDTQV